jgi:tripartite-type tricarboxylate transporter receptor subunit TctC
VFVPALTPGAVTARLNREIASIMRSAGLRGPLVEQGFEPGTATPAAFAKLVREDSARWRRVISEAGLKPE